ncbi:hypothetical protein [Methanococcoides alaskense]|uniref:Uncharacterized protein YwgA n=1 Tax=Methanococcoides alaskense TaxID=325778 RepID=A0AA90TXZ3_9EURY|nr:hypothetical protein [Methanococcoides alaskense]MDA0524902.1 hypothetical protein [Methanococcoides alaskense]MDR6222183.1 uncharacterized protein YwgA [Methanococcoides alaskense]
MSEDRIGQSRKDFLREMFSGIPDIKGRTKLQKIVFLGQEELGLDKQFDYDEYHYGPYSQELTDTLDEMVFEGDIIEDCETHGEYITYCYRLSDSAVSSESKQIPSSTMMKLAKLAKLPRARIIDYVYRKYLPHRTPS